MGDIHKTVALRGKLSAQSSDVFFFDGSGDSRLAVVFGAMHKPSGARLGPADQDCSAKGGIALCVPHVPLSGGAIAPSQK